MEVEMAKKGTPNPGAGAGRTADRVHANDHNIGEITADNAAAAVAAAQQAKKAAKKKD
jgi:hypothetical protein